MPNPRICQDCGTPLGSRKSAVRCRSCSNKVKKGTLTPALASQLTTARHAATREARRLAQLSK